MNFNGSGNGSRVSRPALFSLTHQRTPSKKNLTPKRRHYWRETIFAIPAITLVAAPGAVRWTCPPPIPRILLALSTPSNLLPHNETLAGWREKEVKRTSGEGVVGWKEGGWNRGRTEAAKARRDLCSAAFLRIRAVIASRRRDFEGLFSGSGAFCLPLRGGWSGGEEGDRPRVLVGAARVRLMGWEILGS